MTRASADAGAGAVVALAATRGGGLPLVPLLALVGAGHQVVSWHRSRGPVDAVVASDAGVLASLDLTSRRRGSTTIAAACRVRSVEEHAEASGLGADITFTDVVGLAAPGGPLGEFEPVLVPSPGIDVTRYPVIPPLTRSRMREAYGLTDPLVLAVDRGARSTSGPTSLALASAAVVSDPEVLPLALTLGTPTVVPASLAERFGLTSGVEVVACASDEGPEADRLAASLALDDARCASISRRARRHAERHLDLGSGAAALRVALGLEPEPSLIDLRLAELHTPSSSRVHARAHDALDIFTEAS